MEGCRRQYSENGGEACDANEEDRIAMNLRQPQSMQVSLYMLDVMMQL